MQVLVVNAGSSSLKLRLLDARDQVVESADLPALDPGFDSGSGKCRSFTCSGVRVAVHDKAGDQGGRRHER